VGMMEISLLGPQPTSLFFNDFLVRATHFLIHVRSSTKKNIHTLQRNINSSNISNVVTMWKSFTFVTWAINMVISESVMFSPVSPSWQQTVLGFVSWLMFMTKVLSRSFKYKLETSTKVHGNKKFFSSQEHTIILFAQCEETTYLGEI
jgi:hypothetical protein